MQEPVERYQRRVLIVDDDALQLRAVTRMSRRDPNIELLVTSNPIDALLLVDAQRPDVVILDVFMPGMDGFEVCRRIKANPDTCDVQVVLASAMMDPALAESARLAGATHAIAKPIDLRIVFAEVAAPRTTTAEMVAVSDMDLDVDLHAPATPVRGADLLVSMLADAGVECVFAPGRGVVTPRDVGVPGADREGAGADRIRKATEVTGMLVLEVRDSGIYWCLELSMRVAAETLRNSDELSFPSCWSSAPRSW